MINNGNNGGGNPNHDENGRFTSKGNNKSSQRLSENTGSDAANFAASLWNGFLDSQEKSNKTTGEKVLNQMGLTNENVMEKHQKLSDQKALDDLGAKMDKLEETENNWHNDVSQNPELLESDILSMQENNPEKYEYENDLEKGNIEQGISKWKNLRQDLYNRLISNEENYGFTPEEANQMLDGYLGTEEELRSAYSDDIETLDYKIQETEQRMQELENLNLYGNWNINEQETYNKLSKKLDDLLARREKSNSENSSKALNQMGLKDKDLELADQSPMYKAKNAAIEAGKKGGYDDYSDFDEKGELMARPARTASLLGDTSKFHPEAQVRGIKKFNDGHLEYQLKNPEDKDFRDFRYDEKNGHWQKDLWDFKQKDEARIRNEKNEKEIKDNLAKKGISEEEYKNKMDELSDAQAKTKYGSPEWDATTKAKNDYQAQFKNDLNQSNNNNSKALNQLGLDENDLEETPEEKKQRLLSETYDDFRNTAFDELKSLGDVEIEDAGAFNEGREGEYLIFDNNLKQKVSNQDLINKIQEILKKYPGLDYRIVPASGWNYMNREIPAYKLKLKPKYTNETPENVKKQ